MSVTIPKDAQLEMPLFTDIQLVLGVKWDLGGYEQGLSTDVDAVFQNVMWTFVIKPPYIDLITRLWVNTEHVSKG